MARRDSEARDRILRAAVGVFAERGLKGATTRLVAAAAGVNSALIYYYFEDKQTLYAEAVGFVLHGFLAHLHGRRGAPAGGRARLAFLVDGVFDYYSAHPDRMRVIAYALLTQPKLLGGVLAGLLRGGPELPPLAVLADGMRRRELREAPPIHVWWSILGVCLFSLLLRDVEPHVRPQPAFWHDLATAERRRRIVDLLADGLATRGGGARRRRGVR